MDCPICSKEYPLSEIEEHVENCLSVGNENTTESPQTIKRVFPFEEGAKKPPYKKQRMRNLEASTNSKSIDFLSNDSKSQNEWTKNIPFARKADKISHHSMDKEKNKPDLKSTLLGARKKGEHVPLAEKLRPTDLSSYIGQKQLLGPQTVLGRLLDNAEVPSMILWGPPGCGKTSLANVIARMTKNNSEGKTKFLKLSATSSGIADIREAVSSAAKDLKLGIQTIVFMDEIHRFNKLQQDIFLPHVEAGTFVLIGATTENPSFSLNSALLSRCRVFVLERLEKADILSILEKGIESLGGDLCRGKQDFSAESKSEADKFLIDEEAVNWLVEASNGDARVALGGLEIAVKSSKPTGDSSTVTKTRKISLQELKAGLEKTHTLSERKCDLNYDLISAMQKSVGTGDENASLYWLARLMAGGEDPVYIARRLIRVASEDVGFDDPEALDIAMQTMHACQMIGMPECDVMLGQCAVYLARAAKSRSVEDALRKAQKIISEHKGPQPSVPLHIRDRGGERKLQASLGAGRVHFVRKEEEGRNRLPAGLESLDLFN